MFVCICNAYRDSEIREAAQAGHRTADEAYYWLGDGPCCRRCIDQAQALIDQVHAEPRRSFA